MELPKPGLQSRRRWCGDSEGTPSEESGQSSHSQLHARTRQPTSIPGQLNEELTTEGTNKARRNIPSKQTGMVVKIQVSFTSKHAHLPSYQVPKEIFPETTHQLKSWPTKHAQGQ